MKKINALLEEKFPELPDDLAYFTGIGDSEDGVLCLKVSIGGANALNAHRVSSTFWDFVYVTVGITYELLPTIMALDDADFDDYMYNPMEILTGDVLITMTPEIAREKAEEALKNASDVFERFLAVYSTL